MTNIKNRHTVTAALLAALLVLCGCQGLKVRRIHGVPPPPEAGNAKIIIFNTGNEPVVVELQHEQDTRLNYRSFIMPKTPTVLTVPAGTYHGSVAWEEIRGTLSTHARDKVKLDEGETYEWLVEKKGK